MLRACKTRAKLDTWISACSAAVASLRPAFTAFSKPSRAARCFSCTWYALAPSHTRLIVPSFSTACNCCLASNLKQVWMTKTGLSTRQLTSIDSLSQQVQYTDNINMDQSALRTQQESDMEACHVQTYVSGLIKVNSCLQHMSKLRRHWAVVLYTFPDPLSHPANQLIKTRSAKCSWQQA